MRTVFSRKNEHISSDLDKGNDKFAEFCNKVFVFAFVAHIVFIPIFYLLGNGFVFVNNVIAVFLDLFCLWINRKGLVHTASLIWICEIALHSTICILVFSWSHGYYYYFIALVPVVFFTGWPMVLRLMVTSVLFLLTIFLFYYTNIHPPITQTGSYMKLFMYLSSVVSNFIGLSYASFYYRKNAEQMEQKLLKLADTDALTGISNRRFFEHSVQHELERHQNYYRECALIFFDVDHFKKINDSFGHAAGDMVLQKIAEVCGKSLRVDDIFGRIGGEEFAIFLKNTDQVTALQVAERIRRTIQGVRFELSGRACILLSASVGVTVPQSYKDSLSQLMVRADRAMYQAKYVGRNKVIFLT